MHLSYKMIYIMCIDVHMIGICFSLPPIANVYILVLRMYTFTIIFGEDLT